MLRKAEKVPLSVGVTKRYNNTDTVQPLLVTCMLNEGVVAASRRLLAASALMCFRETAEDCFVESMTPMTTSPLRCHHHYC